MSQSAKCRADQCDRDAAPGGLCWGHWKQKQRGKPFSELRPYGDPKECWMRAQMAYADCDTDAAADHMWRRLYDRLRIATRRKVLAGLKKSKRCPENCPTLG